jgi:hypothetical protein
MPVPPAPGSEPERRRLGGDLADRARAHVEEPGTLRRDARVGDRPRVPDEKALERRRVQVRAAAAATDAAAALVPFTVANDGEPSGVAPGALVASPTPEATTSGFARPSNARPRDENAAIRARSGLAVSCTGPIDTPTSAPTSRAASNASAGPLGTVTTGTPISSDRPSAPGGSRSP